MGQRRFRWVATFCIIQPNSRYPQLGKYAITQPVTKKVYREALVWEDYADLTGKELEYIEDSAWRELRKVFKNLQEEYNNCIQETQVVLVDFKRKDLGTVDF